MPQPLAPSVTLYPEAKRRVRWLNKEEATRLLDALPTHQKQLTRLHLQRDYDRPTFSD